MIRPLIAALLLCLLVMKTSRFYRKLLLSFLALPVIPELKLTDWGLVDVVQGRLLALGT